MEEIDKKIKDALNKVESKPKFLCTIDTIFNIDLNLMKEFITFALDYLEIGQEQRLQIVINSNEDYGASFAHYVVGEYRIAVNPKNRHILDVFRSLAHEMVHYQQDLKGLFNDVEADGTDGSNIENEANAVAGVIMRKYGKQRRELFD